MIYPKTFPGRVRVKFAQNEGHEKATETPQKKNHEKRPNTVFQADESGNPKQVVSLQVVFDKRSPHVRHLLAKHS